MARQQIKRVSAPKTWSIARKSERKWIAKPLPGAHKLEHSLAVLVILRDMLKLARNTKEVKHILNDKQVLINNKTAKDSRQGVGLFDVMAVPKLNKYYRLVLSKSKKLALQEVAKSESVILPVKVKGSTILKGGKQQVNFTNGWNLLDKTKYKTNSSVIYNTEKNKVEKGIELKAGCIVVAISGKHAGILAKLKAIKELGELKKTKIATMASLDDKEEFDTNAEYLFVVGEKSPEFTAVAK